MTPEKLTVAGRPAQTDAEKRAALEIDIRRLRAEVGEMRAESELLTCQLSQITAIVRADTERLAEPASRLPSPRRPNRGPGRR